MILSARRAQSAVRTNWGIGGACLVRSLTLWAMLLRRGIEADLRVGIRRREGKVEGHAWLEYGGLPLNEESSVVGTYSVHDRPVSFDWGLADRG